MKLDDFLKCKKVRCVDNDGCNDLTIGKEYEVTMLSLMVHIIDDGDGVYSYQPRRFEPVIDQAETPLQDMELTPESEAVEPVLADNSVNIQDIDTNILDTNADIKDTPKFKVGDKVYVGLTGKIAQVTEIIDDDVVNIANKNNEVRAWISNICHATTENYERLQATFPGIEFEQPAKELKGSDLARALIKKGWVGFNCLGGHSGDENAITETIVIGINNDGKFTTIDGRLFSNAIPMMGWLPLKAQEVGL